VSNSRKVGEADVECLNCGVVTMNLMRVTSNEEIRFAKEDYWFECQSCREMYSMSYFGDNYKEKLTEDFNDIFAKCEDCGATHSIDNADTGCMCGGKIK